MMAITRRNFTLGALAASFVSFLPAVLRAAAERDPLWFVDPELRQEAQKMQAMMKSFPGFTAEALPKMRKMDFPVPAPSPDVPLVKRQIPGPRGAPPLTIFVINAKAGTSRPGILHTHGGGYIMGSPAWDLRRLQDMAMALDAAIVSVDYRLAPETNYAGSIEDNYTGLLWLHDNAAELGVDRARLAVMGESAGGGHAALLAIAARDRGKIPLAFQCLTYPMLDDRTGSSRQVPSPIGVLAWDAAANRFGWQSFLGRAPGGADVPAAAVPSRTASLAGLAPAWIGVGSIDLFVEEDVDYAKRLIQAGVPTGLVVVPGAYHGFDGTDTDVARRFNAARLAALRKGLSA